LKRCYIEFIPDFAKLAEHGVVAQHRFGLEFRLEEDLMESLASRKVMGTISSLGLFWLMNG